MSDDARRPDPTLKDHPFPVEIELTPVPTAHTMGGMRNWPILPAPLAAYIAVPCRECFPQAPPPGETYDHGEGYAFGHHLPVPGLAWQLGGER